MGKKDGKADKGSQADDSRKAGKAAKAAKPTKAPTPERLSKADYYEQLAPLQLQMNDVARWLQHTGRRLVVVVEGRDTAGKGGVISAISETLNPRQCHVVALGKPSDAERGSGDRDGHPCHVGCDAPLHRDQSFVGR
jgi:polyphosphate kinase 2 (PPK2 family)